MFKIVYVVPLIAPYAVDRYMELAKIDGVEVHVIAEQEKSIGRTGWKFQDIPNVHTYLVDKCMSHKYKKNNENGNYNVSKEHDFPFGLRKIIKQINPDIVLACNSTQLLMLLGPRKYKLGIVVEDTLRAYEGRKKFDKLVKKLLLRSADVYLPFSADAKQFLKYNNIRGPYIDSTWSMDVEFFSDMTEDDKQKFRLTNKINPKKINYILLAALIPRKGIIPFLNGWVRMPNDFRNESELYILGDGELETEIGKFIENKNLSEIHMIGNKPYIDVSHYLQCVDIFVLPTLEDLCSLSVLEAMAAGKPVLTTIYNGARQFVVDGENGYVFDPLDEKSIMDTLGKIDTKEIDRMSKVSANNIRNYSTHKVMTKLYSDLYKFCREYRE